MQLGTEAQSSEEHIRPRNRMNSSDFYLDLNLGNFFVIFETSYTFPLKLMSPSIRN